MMYGSFNRKNDINWLYLRKDQGRIDPTAVEECKQVERKSLDEYFQIHTENLLETVNKEQVMKPFIREKDK